MSSPAARGRRNIQRMAKIINKTLDNYKVEVKAYPIEPGRVAPIVEFKVHAEPLKEQIQANVFTFLKDKRMTRHGPV